MRAVLVGVSWACRKNAPAILDIARLPVASGPGVAENAVESQKSFAGQSGFLSRRRNENFLVARVPGYKRIRGDESPVSHGHPMGGAGIRSEKASGANIASSCDCYPGIDPVVRSEIAVMADIDVA